MGIKAALSKPFAKYIAKKIKTWSAKPLESQQKVFEELLQGAKKTAFGKDHHFDTIKSYEDFKKKCPNKGL